jgi:hypothetical protein
MGRMKCALVLIKAGGTGALKYQCGADNIF